MKKNEILDIQEPHQFLDYKFFRLEEVQELAQSGYEVIPLVESLEQRETAMALYERLRGHGPSFLMESAEVDERQGRYSFIGLNPTSVIRLEVDGMFVNGDKRGFSDPYDFVDKLIAQKKVALDKDMPPFYGGAAGLFGYDLARYKEPSIGQAKPDKLELPEMALIVPGITIAFDHYTQEVSIISNVSIETEDDLAAVQGKYVAAASSLDNMKRRILEETGTQNSAASYPSLNMLPNMSKQQYEASVRKGVAHTEAGDVFQVVPSQRFSSDKPVNGNFTLEAYKKLRGINPSRYGYIFEFGDFSVAGCSPETLVRVTGSHLEHMAIAGTRKRTGDPEEDAALAEDLRTDAKELAEHAMLVDLSRNDVARVCEPSSVDVSRHRAVENYSHVMHLTSEIDGVLTEGTTALQALASILPAGTLSGAPKIRAMQIIDEMEPDKRGFYGGAVGYVTPDGNLDSCIFIRSLVVDKNGYVHVQAGAGVVADSDPASEYQETILKTAAVSRALEAVARPQGKRQTLVTNGQRNAVQARTRADKPPGPKVLLLDNYDSYTYNLFAFLTLAGGQVEVIRNDADVAELVVTKPDFFVVSPGPGHPQAAGKSVEAIKYFAENGVPTLGVCLGHQALSLAFGGDVVRHKPVHGKQSKVTHDNSSLFTGMPQSLEVMRYHSLVVPTPLPPELVRTAYLREDGQEITMGIRHRNLPAEGVQFHPESQYTSSGQTMIANFLTYIP